MSLLRSAFTWAALAACSSTLAQPLSLDEAMKLGEAQSPRLTAQRWAMNAAEQQYARAGELPDPKLRFGIENLPVSGADRFRYDRDFMTSRAVGISQDFPNRQKRAARGERAGRALGVEYATFSSRQAALHRDIALAWLEVHFAEQAREVLQRLEKQLSSQAELSSAAVARGRQSAAESLQLRGAAEQARDRILDGERMVARSRIALATLLGEEAKRPLAFAPRFDRLEVPRDALLGRLHEHPELRISRVREDLARAEVDLARASRRSDWSLEVGYGQRSPAFDNMLTVMVAVDLPWQRERRQDRDVASRLAELEQSRAQLEEARRMHEAQVRTWLADYDSATARIERYESTLLRLANERYELALAAYRGGRGELNVVLEAARATTEIELALVALEAERARAWADLSFLYPHEVHR